MSKHNTTPRTLSRRLVALLAALALLAAMALPVYAEAEPPVQTQETVEQGTNADPGNNADSDNKSETKEGTGTGADTDSDDTNVDTPPNPGANSTTPAGDTAPSTGTTQPPSADNTAPTTAGEDKNAVGSAENENNTEKKTTDSSIDSTSPDNDSPANDSDTNSDDTTTTENGTRKIYYDATFSKLSLNTDNAIPNVRKNNDNVYCYMYKGDDTSNGSKEQMKRLSADSDVYYVDAKEGYDHIVFASYDTITANTISWSGNSTAALEIPFDKYKKPCFYADTGDASMFKDWASDNQRDGYWAELDTLRDAGHYKNKTVVNVPPSKFTAESGTKYINTTLYDYYSDWELNGNNRDSYDRFITTGGNDNNFVRNRNWVTFGQFDQALSDYYQSDKTQTVLYPIYTGHFQPNKLGGNECFSGVASELKLYGWNREENSGEYNTFMSVNNSYTDIDGKVDLAGGGKDNKNNYVFAFQGLTGATRKNGEPVLYGTSLPVPYFNRNFLLTTNSKNAKLGEVYDNVSFPFTKEKVFKDSNENTVEYWHFDSNETTLYLKQDTGNKGYFLQKSEDTDKRNRSRNLKSNSDYQDNGSYGFFPFNEDSTDKQASTYNYGFGAKLQFQFTLTDDGQVYGTDGTSKVPIKFFFSGDDDVWVYIDENLALDVGGEHGKTSGLLEFGQNRDGKLIYTPYVSDVKTSNKVEGVMYKTFVGSKSVQYLKENNTITFKYKGTEKTITPGTHTLTMYYMERGMWESNMAVAFNFPDHNELQVKKEVDVNGVNDLFKSCFTNKRLFNFTIRNQATHYGATATANDTVTTINLLQPNESTPDSKSFTTTATHAAPDTGGENRFTKVTDPPKYLNVTDGTPLLNWYTEFEDLTPSPGSQKDKRYGILKLDGDQTIDITGMSYLSFDIYVDSTAGDAALSNMYLELRDSENKQKGCLNQTFIGGKDLYGQVEMHNKHWITVKLSLDDVKEQDGFNRKSVKELRFGCNYPRSIYLRNIVFSSKAVPQTVTGFTTKQEKIADYGSAASGTLMPAKNAQYTSDAEKGTMVVDENGGFVLKDGETISFKDQFRRGSYLSINEQVDTNLFDTHWTICEDGKAVKETKAGEGTKLTLEGTSKDLENQSGTAPDDGRIENQNAEGDDAQKDKNYNRYNGDKPSENNENDKTIVFRSYANPDAKDVDGETKLKVVFVNTVKTGSLTIVKQKAQGSADLQETYQFRVRFTDVGGHALEDEAIEKPCTVKVDEPFIIENIPVGTRFTIEEVTPTDGSKLAGVSVNGGGSDTTVLDNTVRGSIVEGVAGDENQAVATFTNTKQDLLDITGTKVWQDANGSPVTSNLPDIYVQLQRRHESTQETQEAWEPVPYQNKKYLPVKNSYVGMTFNFLGLPAKDYDSVNQTRYEYQVVEGYLDNKGVFQAVGNNGTIKIDEKVYGVTYTVSNTAAANNSNAKQTVTITNTQQDPKFTLDITKADAEDTTRKLAGVEFKLEKLGENGKDVDNGFPAQIGVTNADGKPMLKEGGEITKIPAFTGLEPGKYRLTETKAAKDYNLLSAPIKVEFTKTGECWLNDSKIEVWTEENPTDFIKNGNDRYTLKLTVLNRKTPTLPHTGADAPSLWLLIGLPLAVAGLLILVFRYNKKGGRQR